jgi:chromosome partitioning protein
MPPKTPRYVASAGLKGGSGKSTLAVNLAAGLALKGRRVVVLDLDPTGAATWSLLAESPERSIVAALDGRARLSAVLAETGIDGLRVAPASRDLEAWNRRPERFPVDLARALGDMPAGTDYVVVDLPPMAGAIVRGALAVLPRVAVLAPVQTRGLDLLGFGELVRLLEDMGEQNAGLELWGIVPMRTNRGALSADVVEALRQSHGGRVLPGIRDAAAVARAPLSHRPVAVAAPKSGAAEDFAALVRAFLKREGDQ